MNETQLHLDWKHIFTLMYVHIAKKKERYDKILKIWLVYMYNIIKHMHQGFIHW